MKKTSRKVSESSGKQLEFSLDPRTVALPRYNLQAMIHNTAYRTVMDSLAATQLINLHHCSESDGVGYLRPPFLLLHETASFILITSEILHKFAVMAFVICGSAPTTRFAAAGPPVHCLWTRALIENYQPL